MNSNLEDGGKLLNGCGRRLAAPSRPRSRQSWARPASRGVSRRVSHATKTRERALTSRSSINDDALRSTRKSRASPPRVHSEWHSRTQRSLLSAQDDCRLERKMMAKVLPAGRQVVCLHWQVGRRSRDKEWGKQCSKHSHCANSSTLARERASEKETVRQIGVANLRRVVSSVRSDTHTTWQEKHVFTFKIKAKITFVPALLLKL